MEILKHLSGDLDNKLRNDFFRESVGKERRWFKRPSGGVEEFSGIARPPSFFPAAQPAPTYLLSPCPTS